MVDFNELLRRHRERRDDLPIGKHDAQTAGLLLQKAIDFAPEAEAMIHEQDLTPPVEEGPDPLAPWKAEPYAVLAGTAGTGKSFFSRDWAARDKGVVLAATTGIAAINLGGQTINGLLGYYNTESLNQAYLEGRLESRLTKLHKAGLRRIVLDEMSMLDGDQLTLLTRALEDLAGRGYKFLDVIDDEGEPSPPVDESTQPVSLTLVGDFCQLPPVRAPFAFESQEWERYAAHVHTLTDIRRQSDPDFIAAIHAARRGDGATAAKYFVPRMVTALDNHFDGPTIFAKNDTVVRFNAMRHDELKTPMHIFRGQAWLREDREKEPGEWQLIPRDTNKQPAVGLKEGALVMVLANARGPLGELLYVNGDLGDLVGAEGTVALVALRRTGEVVRIGPITRAIKVPLEVGRRKALKATGHEDRIEGKWEIVGQITYMPLRLAYATTVHKSQGLTLDQVQIGINEHFFGHPGMMFVALSRARSSEGLRIVGHPGVFQARCTVDARVKNWL